MAEGGGDPQGGLLGELGRGMLVGEHKMMDDLQDDHRVKPRKSSC